MSSRARRKKAEMNGNSLGVALSSGGLAGAERSEGERSEPQRSAAPAKAGADSGMVSRPDPEVVAKAKRHLHRRIQATHLARGRICCCDARRSGRSAPPRRSVLVSADLLAARAGPRSPGSPDSTETRAEVQAPAAGRRKSEASPSECTLDRRSA